MALPKWLARFNRRVTNRVTGTFADRLPGFGILIHTGRRSGKTYWTPVNVFRDGNDYIIVLTYGSESDWVRNVLAAGACEMVTRGRRVSLTHPRIIIDPSIRWAPPLLRLIPRLAGVTEYMRLTSLPAPSGATGALDARPGQERSLRE
jgi:deazaflavin-dependent oxidoreductase (nitroreductase family)